MYIRLEVRLMLWQIAILTIRKTNFDVTIFQEREE